MARSSIPCRGTVDFGGRVVDRHFEWDEVKADANRRRHRIDFAEAATIFTDPSAITMADPDHSVAEDRYVDIGISDRGRCLVVVYTERAGRIRIISCRPATRREKRQYNG